MKAVILAGGLGTRLSEETGSRPKPMVDIGGKPILWHILKMYSRHGITEFIICCGYKGEVIKEYFNNYFLRMSDVTFDMRANQMRVHHNKAEDWRVTLVDTGEKTMTGGRLARIAAYVQDAPFFHFTYGDGVSDVDLTALSAFHGRHGKLATLTAVLPPGRYGALHMQGDQVRQFTEKPAGDGGYINGGFFVLSPKVIGPYATADVDCIWEQRPLKQLAADGELMAWRHDGFWRPMDTLRDKTELENLWTSGAAPWHTWR